MVPLCVDEEFCGKSLEEYFLCHVLRRSDACHLTQACYLTHWARPQIRSRISL